MNVCMCVVNECVCSFMDVHVCVFGNMYLYCA